MLLFSVLNVAGMYVNYFLCSMVKQISKYKHVFDYSYIFRCFVLLNVWMVALILLMFDHTTLTHYTSTSTYPPLPFLKIINTYTDLIGRRSRGRCASHVLVVRPGEVSDFTAAGLAALLQVRLYIGYRSISVCVYYIIYPVFWSVLLNCLFCIRLIFSAEFIQN